MKLSERCNNILIQLSSSDKPIAISDLSDIYKVSERTIRYDIKEIEYWLKQNDLGTIEAVYGKGLILISDSEQKSMIDTQLSGYDSNDNYYSNEERQKIIIIELLNSEEPLKSAYFQEKIGVSRGTVMKELKAIEKWLPDFGLNLIKKPNYGIKIEGSESSKRNALLNLVKNFVTTEQLLGIIRTFEPHTSTTTNNGKRHLFNDILMSNNDLKKLDKSLYKLQNLLGFHLSDNSFASLFTHLAIALQRIKSGKNIFFPPEDLVLLEKTKEFEIGQKFSKILEADFGTAIPRSEIGYLTLHILAAQLHSVPEVNGSHDDTSSSVAVNHRNAKELLINDDEIDFMEMAQDITNYVKTQLNFEFQNEETLVLDLCIHLKPAVHRCRYKMFLTNPLLEDIKQNYYRIFLIVKEALLVLQVKYPVVMNDHEISYLALHFAAEIENGKGHYKRKLNVILVCASGIGTAKMLYNRIDTNFSDLNIVDTISYLDFFKRTDWPIDMVISTIKLRQNDYPCIVVNPLLKKEDIEKIEKFMFTKRDRRPQPTSNEPDLSNTVLSDADRIELHELLIPEHIQLDVLAATWEDALKAGADILLSKDYITSNYVDSVIENVHNLGPYIVIAPGIAFSHASHESGVNKLSMSLIRLKDAVVFNHEANDPVKLIFTLAPTDRTSHYGALTSLMELLLDQRQLNILFNAPKLDDITKVIGNL